VKAHGEGWPECTTGSLTPYQVAHERRDMNTRRAKETLWALCLVAGALGWVSVAVALLFGL